MRFTTDTLARHMSKYGIGAVKARKFISGMEKDVLRACLSGSEMDIFLVAQEMRLSP